MAMEMEQYDNILLIEIENPREIGKMKKYLSKKYPIRGIYDVGAVIAVKCEPEIGNLKEKIQSENGVRQVISYKPIK